MVTDQRHGTPVWLPVRSPLVLYFPSATAHTRQTPSPRARIRRFGYTRFARLSLPAAILPHADGSPSVDPLLRLWAKQGERWNAGTLGGARPSLHSRELHREHEVRWMLCSARCGHVLARTSRGAANDMSGIRKHPPASKLLRRDEKVGRRPWSATFGSCCGPRLSIAHGQEPFAARGGTRPLDWLFCSLLDPIE